MAVRKLEQLQAIRKAIDKLDGDLLAAARKIIELVGTDDVERLRAALESYLLPAAKLAASSAGELGAAAYNTWRYEDLGEKIETVTSSAYDEGKYLSAINAATMKPTVDEMLATLSGRIGYTSRASYSVSLFENGRHDPKKPRYARCPGSGETCQFCLMLASKGFEYSKGKLGENVHNHDNCKCTYTCSWDPRPEAQGYDSKKYYDEWQASIDKEAKERAERNGTSIEAERKQIMERYKEQSKRSKAKSSAGAKKQEDKKPESAKGVKSRVVDYDKAPRNIRLEKSWEKLERHEKAGFWHVSRSGAKDIRLIDEDPDAPANFDLKVGGRVWEMKNVTNAESSVSNQVKRARKKWLKTGRSDHMRVVITTEGLEGNFEDVLEGVEKRLRPGEVAIVYDENGNGTRLKK